MRVADGNQLQCRGRFEQVWVNLQGIPFALTLHSLPLTGLDLVLGVQWLEQLGPMVCNWQRMTMEFHWKDQARKLQGSNNPTTSASLKVVSKEVNQGSSTFAIYLQTMYEVDKPTYIQTCKRQSRLILIFFMSPRSYLRPMQWTTAFHSRMVLSPSMYGLIGMPIFKRLK